MELLHFWGDDEMKKLTLERIKYKFLLYIFILFAVFLFFYGIASVAASTEITVNKTTDTSIFLSWNDTYYKDIYVDGVKIVNNTNLGYYIANGFSANTPHRIDIVNVSDGTKLTKEFTTKIGSLWFMLGIVLVFFIIGFWFPLLHIIALIMSFVAGTMALNSTTEGWIIISIWLMFVFSMVALHEEV